MKLDIVKVIPFKNFCYMQNKTWCAETLWLDGTFKESDGTIVNNDKFEAHKVLGCSVEEIYKLYIEWFNLTLRHNELSREFVSVKEFSNE
jgi:hypothetical protein